MSRTDFADLVDELAREPLRNIVLLKHLLAYPEHVRVHRAADSRGTATLVTLPTAVSAYDRQAYPDAALAALIASDHPELTAKLLTALSGDVGMVFKLSREADLAPVASRFPVARRTAFVSFTAAGAVGVTAEVCLTAAPDDATFRLFEGQGHARDWLAPLLRQGKAFVCLLARDGAPRSACFAFETHGPVWEVGGVVTAPDLRQQGLAARVVRTALAELGRRGLAPRYQVEAGNTASIRLARSVGLAPFLTITHYVYDPHRNSGAGQTT